ncbi:FecR domain-containing protein [Chitinophaga sedimenti]|uniref:FecR family protein n=1 Tax=Chitinophaga sedimenti TaxID=2033606 RepID=UPI00200463A0|nr:FecR family protein [Chitinophaga sedimenti]MCK7553626.1 FecR domain-containing protein [Chitinophaga sedimenti]
MSREATPEEQDELAALMEQPQHKELDPLLKASWDQLQVKETLSTADKNRIVDHILKKRATVHPIRRYWWAAAAAVLIAVGAGYQFNRTQRQDTNQLVTTGAPDVAPGRQGAILTLSNGQTIVLDSLHNGVIAQQSGTQVTLSNGQLAYDALGAADVVYNTMTTPRGRHFQLMLADGTMVWLNAASSLRFPNVFTGSQRVVEVTGEAYFEVAKNAAQPFIVKVNEHTQVEVTGTSFNINAYVEEAAITTTLLSGGVNIHAHGVRKSLRPGQQASIIGSGIRIQDDAETEMAIAWKNGLLDFNGANLREVMRKLTRWYDLDVIYEGKIPDAEFEGALPNNLQLSQVIKILTKVEVKFRIEEGRKLIVLADK